MHSSLVPRNLPVGHLEFHLPETSTGSAGEICVAPGCATALRNNSATSATAAVIEIPVSCNSITANKVYRVLLVDDEPNLCRLVTMLLGRAGHEVVSCEDFAHGKQEFESGNHFDILVTDMSMPGGSGLDLARAAVEQLPNLRTLLISGYPIGEELLSEFKRPIQLLEKPFSREALLGAIEDLMQKN